MNNNNLLEVLTMYKALPTGRGDYAIVYQPDSLPAVTHSTGMDHAGAECLAQSMQTDLDSVSREELIACSTPW